MFNFTSDERRAILFLAFVYFLGLGIIFLSKQLEPRRTIASFNVSLGKINLNNADKGLLMKVPGIGEILSQRIIDFRRSSGGFSSVDELNSIKGINKALFNRIKDYLTTQ